MFVCCFLHSEPETDENQTHSPISTLSVMYNASKPKPPINKQAPLTFPWFSLFTAYALLQHIAPPQYQNIYQYFWCLFPPGTRIMGVMTAKVSPLIPSLHASLEYIIPNILPSFLSLQDSSILYFKDRPPDTSPFYRSHTLFLKTPHLALFPHGPNHLKVLHCTHSTTPKIITYQTKSLIHPPHYLLPSSLSCQILSLWWLIPRPCFGCIGLGGHCPFIISS